MFQFISLWGNGFGLDSTNNLKHLVESNNFANEVIICKS
jgi:hypothetical protein